MTDRPLNDRVKASFTCPEIAFERMEAAFAKVNAAMQNQVACVHEWRRGHERLQPALEGLEASRRLFDADPEKSISTP